MDDNIPWFLEIEMGVPKEYEPPLPKEDFTETPLAKAIAKIKERASVMSTGEALSILRDLLPYEQRFIKNVWDDGDQSHSPDADGCTYRYSDFDELWEKINQGENDERSVATVASSE